MGWTATQTPDQHGRTFLITGGNSGIGFEAARVLAEHSAEVVLACRSMEKAQQALDALRKYAPAAKTSFLQLDLADLSSIRRAAAEAKERFKKIDVLINNAGVMALPYTKTRDGFEMQLGTNHLGHFAFTGLLLPAIQERIVNVSSAVHLQGKINFEDLMSEKSYKKWKAYFQSKLANMLFTFELDRRLKAANNPLKVLACHPGYAATNLQTAGPIMEKRRFLQSMMEFGNAIMAQPASQGAWPTLYAAVGDLPSGTYTGPSGFFEGRGPAHISPKVAKAARNEEDAARLWQISEELTKVTFSFK